LAKKGCQKWIFLPKLDYHDLVEHHQGAQNQSNQFGWVRTLKIDPTELIGFDFTVCHATCSLN